MGTITGAYSDKSQRTTKGNTKAQNGSSKGSDPDKITQDAPDGHGFAGKLPKCGK